jgi:transcriptional regulator with XRE-family HTH domain
LLTIESKKEVCKHTYMTISERIRQSREKAGLSQGELARRIGISRAAITQWENPKPNKKIKLDAGNLLKCADICGVDPNWLQFGIYRLKNNKENNQNTPFYRNFPLLRIPDIDKWLYNPVLNQEYRVIQMPMMDDNVSEKAFLYEAVGSAMFNSQNPKESISPGELVLVDPDIAPQSGELVLVKFAESDIRIRQYQEDGAKKFFKAFENHNPIEAFIDGIVILGTIIKAGSWRTMRKPI